MAAWIKLLTDAIVVIVVIVVIVIVSSTHNTTTTDTTSFQGGVSFIFKSPAKKEAVDTLRVIVAAESKRILPICYILTFFLLVQSLGTIHEVGVYLLEMRVNAIVSLFHSVETGRAVGIFLESGLHNHPMRVVVGEYWTCARSGCQASVDKCYVTDFKDHVC
jgi:hypothetical protein